MINYKKGDATKPVSAGNKIITHVCNDKGGWGRGFVLALNARWKQPEQEYRNWFKTRQNFELGEVQFIQVEQDTRVANMIGQHDTKPDVSGNPPVRYDAIAKALNKVAEFAKTHHASVHMPRIGCGLAGGTWDKMEEIVAGALVNSGVSVTVYDL